MGRFGFNQDPPLDYPDAQMQPSGVRNSKGKLVTAGFDVGRVAIGQGGEEGQIQVTPLQMAMVAAAVGNRGKLIKPRLTDKIVQPDGRTIETIEPSEQSVVMSAKAADQLTADDGQRRQRGDRYRGRARGGPGRAARPARPR